MQKRLLYPWGQLAVDESWLNMCITTRAPSKQIPGICLLQLGHLESRCGMWLVKLAYSKKIWVWDGLSGFQWCVANWFGGGRHLLGARKDVKTMQLNNCWQISVQKRLLYPLGQLAVDESWVNMCITTRAPSKQIPGICLLQLGHLESRCGMWLVKLAYSKKIWVWDGLSGFQWCVANWFGGADTCLGQEKT